MLIIFGLQNSKKPSADVLRDPTGTTLLQSAEGRKMAIEIISQDTKFFFNYCTCLAARVTYNFHSSCKHMHLSFKSLCNKEYKGKICNEPRGSHHIWDFYLEQYRRLLQTRVCIYPSHHEKKYLSMGQLHVQEKQ